MRYMGDQQEISTDVFGSCGDGKDRNNNVDYDIRKRMGRRTTRDFTRARFELYERYTVQVHLI